MTAGEPIVRSTKWDTRSLAFLGLTLGGLAGMALEISELYVADINDPGPNGLEPLGSISLDIASFALGGALLFAAVSAIRRQIWKR